MSGGDRMTIQQPSERLAFNDSAALPARRVRAQLAQAESGQWGYRGLLAFTAVLLLRQQDQIAGLAWLHPAQICGVIGLGAMMLHRFARRLPMLRMTPEMLGLFAFGLVMLITAPFSVWPGGALNLALDPYLKVVLVFVLM